MPCKVFSNKNMKNVSLSIEKAQDLVTKISSFKTERNKVRLSIGVQNLGDGLACTATIVNGGMMESIGFKTSDVPKNYEEGKPYFEVVANAASFVSYLSSLLPYNSNIEMSYDEKGAFFLKVASAKVRVETSETMDALLPDTKPQAVCSVSVDTTKFLNTLKTGGYLASAAVDERGVTDRVALRFTEEEVVIYSTNLTVMSKAWCNVVAKFNKPGMAMNYLKDKYSALEESQKQVFGEKIQAVSKDAASAVALAEQEGFTMKPLYVALPVNAISVIRTIFGGTESVNILISDSQLIVNAGNVIATFTLAGRVSEVYEKTVDNWQNVNWTSQVMVDKEALNNALNIIRLGGAKTPFGFSYKSKKLLAKDKAGNVVATTVVQSSGDEENINVYLDAEKMLQVTGKLPNGNMVIRFFCEPGKKTSYPISVSDGDLDGKGVNCYLYVFPVNVTQEPKKESETEPKEPEKVEKVVVEKPAAGENVGVDVNIPDDDLESIING